MRRGWRWSLAGLLLGALAGAAALHGSVVGAAAEEPVGTAARGQLRDVLHTPPQLVARGEPVSLRYEVVCSVDELGTPCSLSGRLYVRAAGGAAFSQLPLVSEGGAAFTASPPQRLTRNGFEYYAVVETAGGEALTLPAEGAAAPQRATVVPTWTDVELGTHRFGHVRPPERAVAAAGWGAGRGELGLDSGPDQARIGPSAFDVGADGSLVVLDQINRRLARYERDAVVPRQVPIAFSGGEGDLALGPDGTVHVLDDGGAATRRPVVRSFDPAGRPLSTAPLAARSADMLRMGPEGPLAHAVGAEAWLPVARGRIALPLREQIARALSERPVGGGAGLLVHATPSEARFALVRGDRVLRAWRLTSSTPLGEVQLAEPYGSGLLVVLRVWTETEAEFRVLELTPAGPGHSFSVARAEWAESAPLSRFRLAGGALYQLRSDAGGAQVVAFDLGETR